MPLFRTMLAVSTLLLTAGPGMAEPNAMSLPCSKFLTQDHPTVPPEIIYSVRDTPAGHGLCCGVDIELLVLTECRLYENFTVRDAVEKMIADYRLNRLPAIPASHNQQNDPRIDADWKAFDRWLKHQGPQPAYYHH